MSDNIKVLISAEKVDARIREIAAQINEDYKGRSIHMISILKGGAYFMTELSKYISEDIPVTFDFMQVSSYGNGTESSGHIKFTKDLDESIQGRDVIIVEDIIDTGHTLFYLMDLLAERKPASVKLCTLLDKPGRRVRDVKVDYEGFRIDDLFVVGCGMDYAQKYRNLPYIGVIETE